MDQPDAENYCVAQFNSHLATITSPAENAVAYNMVIEKNTFIGLNDILNEGNYVWSDGSTAAYRNWGSGEPNNWDNEDCVILYGPTQPTDKSKWHDTDCVSGPEIDFLCNDMTSSCLSEDYIGTFIWSELLSGNVSHRPYVNLNMFTIDTSDLTLNIEVELSYLQSTTSEINDNGYGTTYWLDFQSFNGNNMNRMYEPGSCGNRLSSSYYTNQTLRDFIEWWLFSERPYNDGQLGSDSYLAYPDAGNVWSISTMTGDFETKCSRIKYNALFSWSKLLSCDGIGNTIKVNEDDNFINLTGIFYVNVVSPLDKGYDTGYYRVYELLSQPFSTSLRKTAHVLSSIGLNLFDVYLLSIFSENENGNFVINVITESAEYIYLNEATLINYPSHLSNAQSINYPSDPITTSCIAGINNICRQIFQINVEFGYDYCETNNVTNFDLSGLYTFSFNINCGNSSNCNEYINDYGSTAILSFDTTYIDETCNVIKPTNISSYTAEMRFYLNSNYQNYSNKSILYDYGDTVYVEIEATNLPEELFESVSLSLVNVWICQYDDKLALPDPQTNVLDGGCLANSTYDFSLYYRIYPTLLFNTMLKEENISNIVRFSFMIPEINYSIDSENRDKLFIHAEVEIFLNLFSTRRRRRTLLSTRSSNFVQIGDDITIQITDSDTEKQQNPNGDEDEDEDEMIVVIAILSILILILILVVITLFYNKRKHHKEKKQNNTQKSRQINIQMQTNEIIA